MTRLVDEHRELVDTLEDILQDAKNVSQARAEMRKRFGHFEVEADNEEIRFLAQEGAVEAALLRDATGQQTILVAGA